MTEGHPLLDSGEVEVPLEEYLHRVGEVVATIRGHDSGNTSYGVLVGRERWFVKYSPDEEFERGAVIDQRTTVYTLGRAAFVF
jgi:hypothetical protein